jgi:cobalt-zinc-cadmium efflux system protein
MSKPHQHQDPHQNLKIVFWLNFGFAILELIGGLLSNSMAILSDALHDLGDSLSILLAWILARISQKKRTENYSYGWQRFSLMGALINALILIVGSLFILNETIPRMLNPEPVTSWLMITMAVFGVLVNGFAVIKMKSGKSMNEKVISLHLWEDVLGWTAVLIGSIIIYFTGWYILDAFLALGVTIFILVTALKSIKESAAIFLQAIPNEIRLKDIAHNLKAIEGVKSIHDFHVWSLDGENHVGSLHVVIEANGSPENIKELIRSQ